MSALAKGSREKRLVDDGKPKRCKFSVSVSDRCSLHSCGVEKGDRFMSVVKAGDRGPDNLKWTSADN
jgi:hypothetical protein